ncbi:unnamed protein product [Caenorhabditis sp. 36 PRJEB53466]|nr:unnamed protein product [Caenorhabditis sp. 36 PRJEB53466]
MSTRTTLRDDSQEPSTSTANPQCPPSIAALRRRADNLKKFERLIPKIRPVSLWHLCTAKQRGRRLQTPFSTELRALRLFKFSTLLKPHQTYLNDLARKFGSTYEELCQDLRFFAYFQKQPGIRNEAAYELFKHVAHCVIYSENKWKSEIDKKTLYDSVTARLLSKRIDEKVKEEDVEMMDTSEKAGPSTESQNEREVTRGGRISWSVRLPALSRPFNTDQDEHLEAMHAKNKIGCNDSKFNAAIEKLMRTVIVNNRGVRTKPRQLSDIEYYGDDHVLVAAKVSFRIENLMQIADFKFPDIHADGYFPPEVTDRHWYLYSAYTDANDTCKREFDEVRKNGRGLRNGFVKTSATCDELYEWHMAGRHIHGFFDVWEESDRGWKRADGKWISRRYLVDIYNRVMFPLYVGWEDWPKPLRWAFDKYSLYGLRLMTLIRKHAKGLSSVGDSLFSKYSIEVEKWSNNLASNKNRNQYLVDIQTENTRVVERCLGGSSDGNLTPATPQNEDGRKRRRKGRKSEVDGATPVKMARTPRKLSVAEPLKFTTPSTSSARSLNQQQQQKENMEKLMMSPPPGVTTVAALVAAAVSAATTTAAGALQPQSVDQSSPRRNSQSVIKRRHEESTFQPAPVPTKKPSVDRWEEQGNMDEEHVEEEDESSNGEGDGQRETPGVPGGNVWVPADRGREVAPEQYAKEICEHYGIKRGRFDYLDSELLKRVRRNSAVALPLPPPSFSIPPGPLADLVADGEGDRQQNQPTAPALPPPKAKRQRRATNPPKQNPLSTLLSPESSSTPSTSTTPISFPINGTAPHGVPLAKPRILPTPHHPEAPPTGVTKFPVKVVASAAPKTPHIQAPAQNGVTVTATSPSVIVPRAINLAVQKRTPPARVQQTTPQQRRPYVARGQRQMADLQNGNRLLQKTEEVDEKTKKTKNYHPVEGTCRRALPFGEQRNCPLLPHLCQQQHEGTRMSSSAPPVQMPTPPPAPPQPVQPITKLVHRRRLHLQRSLQHVRRRREVQAPPSTGPLEQQHSSGPLLLSPPPSTSSTPRTRTSFTPMPSNPLGAQMLAQMQAQALAQAQAQFPVLPSGRPFSGQTRTKLGNMTPQQIGDAIRNESARFQEGGQEGPTVRTFLLNFQPKN